MTKVSELISEMSQRIQARSFWDEIEKISKASEPWGRLHLPEMMKQRALQGTKLPTVTPPVQVKAPYPKAGLAKFIQHLPFSKMVKA